MGKTIEEKILSRICGNGRGGPSPKPISRTSAPGQLSIGLFIGEKRKAFSLSPVRNDAFARINSLPDVVQFKKRFYPSTWAQYDLATPGSFKLLPTAESQIRNLELDYQDMQVMFFGEPPSFFSILEVLRDLASEINAIPTETP
jgi:hypothetical protein